MWQHNDWNEIRPVDVPTLCHGYLMVDLCRKSEAANDDDDDDDDDEDDELTRLCHKVTVEVGKRSTPVNVVTSPWVNSCQLLVEKGIEALRTYQAEDPWDWCQYLLLEMILKRVSEWHSVDDYKFRPWHEIVETFHRHCNGSSFDRYDGIFCAHSCGELFFREKAELMQWLCSPTIETIVERETSHDFRCLVFSFGRADDFQGVPSDDLVIGMARRAQQHLQEEVLGMNSFVNRQGRAQKLANVRWSGDREWTAQWDVVKHLKAALRAHFPGAAATPLDGDSFSHGAKFVTSTFCVNGKCLQDQHVIESFDWLNNWTCHVQDGSKITYSTGKRWLIVVEPTIFRATLLYREYQN